jgi:uncharacterized protein (TIGR03067 family)
MRICALPVAALLQLAAVGLLAAAGDAREEAAKKDLEAMKGIWTVVSAEKDGKKISEEALQGFTVTYDGKGKAVAQREGIIFFRGTIRLDPTKKPKTMDSTQMLEGDSKGKIYPAIYEINGDTMRVCSTDPGKARPTEFSSKPGSGYFFRVYKREKN